MKSIMRKSFLWCAALAAAALLVGCDVFTLPEPPLDAPARLTAEPAGSSVGLSWDYVGGATTYKIYVSTDADSSSAKYVSSTSSNSYTYYISYSSGGNNNEKLYFWVKASDGDKESDFSSTAILPASTNLTATAQSSSSVSLSWISVSDATKYEIYYSTSPSTPSYSSYDYSTTSTSYTVTGLSAGTKYYFWVKASSDTLKGFYSSSAYATTEQLAPNAPTSLYAVAQSSSSVSLSWDSVSGATGYEIYYSTSSSSSSPSYYTYTTSTSCTVTGLSSGTTYYFWVKAYNSNGKSGFSSYDYATTHTSTTTYTSTPTAPTGLYAVAQSSSSIKLTWSSVSGATEYYIYKSTSSSSLYSLLCGYTTATSYTVTGLSSGTTYYFWVKAYNSNGLSGLSSYASATTSYYSY